MSDFPNPLFVRPVSWRNDSVDYPYSIGASACMVRFKGELYVLTAKHVLDRPEDMRAIEDAFIPQRFDSIFRVGLPHVSEILPMPGTEGSVVNCDIQICTVQLNPNDSGDISDCDYVEMGDLGDSGYAQGRSYLIGYPNHAQNIDYENGISFREALIAEGRISEDHPDDGVLWFYSPTILEEDINGMSGGAIASYDESEGWRLEGICVSGSGQNNASRAGFVGRRYLLDQLEAFRKSVALRTEYE